MGANINVEEEEKEDDEEEIKQCTMSKCFQ